MVSFTSKKLTKQSAVADSLRRARQAAELTVEKAARQIGISPKYLLAIETSKFSVLPGTVYAKKFIAKYAEFLGLNAEALVSEYLLENNGRVVTEDKNKMPRCGLGRVWNGPALLRRGATLLLTAALVYYLGAEVGGIFAPPPLTLDKIEDGKIVTINKLEIAGTTLPEIRVQVNGVEKVSDWTGHFNETITLNPGLNRLVVTAVKKHGRAVTETRNVIYEEKLGRNDINP